jgi:flagellar biosynthesis/type III secretory pathway protein FliH
MNLNSITTSTTSYEEWWNPFYTPTTSDTQKCEESESFSQDDLDEARDRGYDEGFEEGRETGYNCGYDDAKSECDECYTEDDVDEARDEGYHNGYNEGYREAKVEFGPDKTFRLKKSKYEFLDKIDVEIYQFRYRTAYRF